jgi:hypothetical protein
MKDETMVKLDVAEWRKPISRKKYKGEAAQWRSIALGVMGLFFLSLAINGWFILGRIRDISVTTIDPGVAK